MDTQNDTPNTAPNAAPITPISPYRQVDHRLTQTIETKFTISIAEWDNARGSVSGWVVDSITLKGFKSIGEAVRSPRWQEYKKPDKGTSPCILLALWGVAPRKRKYDRRDFTILQGMAEHYEEQERLAG